MLVINILTANREQVEHIDAAGLEKDTGRGFEHSVGSETVSIVQLVDWLLTAASGNV